MCRGIPGERNFLHDRVHLEGFKNVDGEATVRSCYH